MNEDMLSGYDIMAGILSREETRLRLELLDIRKKYEHPGNKGDQVESIIRDFLSQYLPAYNRVGHGEVFNIEGLHSKQTDLVVTNEYHVALTSDWTKAQTFIIESVECAAEIKSTINDVDTDLRDIFEKAKTFKSMFIEPGQGMEARLQPDDTRRFLWRKPYFGFAFESKVSLDRIIQELKSWDEELRPVERPVLDSLFILDRGGFMHMGSGQGRLVSIGSDGQRKTGYVALRKGGEQVLTTLLLWIYSTMPKIHYYTHPAFVYLTPNSSGGRLQLQDDGNLSRPTGGHNLGS